MYHRGFRSLLPDALWYCRLGGTTSKRSAKAVIRGNLVAIDIVCKSTDMNIKLNNWNFTISTYSSAMTRYSGVLSEPGSSTVSKLTFSYSKRKCRISYCLWKFISSNTVKAIPETAFYHPTCISWSGNLPCPESTVTVEELSVYQTQSKKDSTLALTKGSS